MGIFDTYRQVKSGNQRISENFLRKQGFKKYNNWGSPKHWGEKGSEFWEKFICLPLSRDFRENIYSATLYYFPSGFERYVTDFDIKGIKPENHFLGWINDCSRFTKEISGEANCKMDILYAIDRLTEELKK